MEPAAPEPREPPTLATLPPEVHLYLLAFLYADPKSLLIAGRTCRALARAVATPGVASAVARLLWNVNDLEAMPFLSSPRSAWTPSGYLRRILLPHGRLLGLWHGDAPAYDGRLLHVALDPRSGSLVGFERDPAVPESVGPRGQPGAVPLAREFSLDPSVSVDALLDSPAFASDVAHRGATLISVIAAPSLPSPGVSCHGLPPRSRHARWVGTVVPGATLHAIRVDWGGRGWIEGPRARMWDPTRAFERLLGMPGREEGDEERTRGFPDQPFGPPDESGLHPPPRATAIPAQLQFTADSNTFLPLSLPSPNSPTPAPHDTFTLSCPSHSPLPVIVCEPAGAGAPPRAAYRTVWSRISLPAAAKAGPFRTGLWLGTYGAHGLEYLLCRPARGAEGGVEFVKVTGDANVPRGAVSIWASEDGAPGRRVHHAGREWRMDASAEFRARYPAPGTRGWEPTVHRGWATVAHSGYANPSRIDATVVLLDEGGTDAAVVWHELESVGRLRHVGS